MDKRIHCPQGCGDIVQVREPTVMYHEILRANARYIVVKHALDHENHYDYIDEEGDYKVELFCTGCGETWPIPEDMTLRFGR